MSLCAVRGKVHIHDTIIVDEIKRHTYEQSYSKRARVLLLHGIAAWPKST